MSSRIMYKCAENQRNKPLALRTHWDVYDGTECIATIDTKNEPSSERSHSLRIWNAKLRGAVFDPFDFPHIDEDAPEEGLTQPYVRVANGTTELVNPQAMTMGEARSWVKQVALRGKNEN